MLRTVVIPGVGRFIPRSEIARFSLMRTYNDKTKGPLLSQASAAKALGVPLHAVRHMLDQGKLHAVRKGSGRWIPASEVARILEGEKDNGTDERD